MNHPTVPEWGERFAHLTVSNSPPSDSEAVEILDIIDANKQAIARLDSEIHPLVNQRNQLTTITRSLALLLSTKRTLPFDVVVQIFRTAVDSKGTVTNLPSIELWTSLDIDHSAINPKMRPSGSPLE
ncbi:hypothetical protein FB451DRAFT_1401570 [Mycena latifolia]|nr:hypothetical protein FB451DRAFT_1401570 [Mycena latifolia]